MDRARKSTQTRKVCRSVAVILSGLLAAIGAGACQASDDPFADLRLRIERLEQDNRELRSALASQPAADSPAIAGAVPPSPAELTVAPQSDEERRIAGLVEEYLQRRPNAADSAQDQSIVALYEQTAGIVQRLNAKSYPFVQVHGAFQADVGFFNQDDNSRQSYGAIHNGGDFRRARLSANGSLTESTNYLFQMDFAFFGRPTFTDLWVEQTGIPGLGTVRLGQWKQPFSLEVVSSYRYTTFAERSVLFQTFTPFRHLGAGFYNHSEGQRMTWAASVFASGQDQYGGSLNSLGDGVGTAERFTCLPYWNDATNGNEYLHLGIAHYFNSPPDQVGIFRTIPELYIGNQAGGVVGTSGQAAPGAFNGTPFFVNTGPQGVSYFNVLGGEVLWVNGPLSVQSEGMLAFVNQIPNVPAGLNALDGGSQVLLSGMYAQVGYFLTGEHRPYDRKAGAIDRIIPHRNFGPSRDGREGGFGAWELAGRFSYIDLNDKNFRGGQMQDYTAGVNWFLNPYWKIQFNYIYSLSDFSYPGSSPASNRPADTFLGNRTSIFDVRCQIDF